MDMIYKSFRAELKGVDEDGSLNMFIPVSTDSMDRDSEIIEPGAFKKTIPKFMKHPVLVASHDYGDLTNQIGEWSKLKITENGIEGKPKYYVGMGNEQADWAYKLAQKGVAAFSIGFIPKVWEDGDGEKSARRTYKDIELLEISQVIIPSNRDAIMGMRSKSVDPMITQLIDDIVNAEIVDLTEAETITPVEKKPTQAEIGDELDYLLTLVKDSGISPDNKDKALELSLGIIERFPGADIPVEIREKIALIVGQTREEKEHGKLSAIKEMVEHKLEQDAKSVKEEKQRVAAVHRIVEQMFVDLANKEEQTKVDMLRKIVRSKLEVK